MSERTNVCQRCKETTVAYLSGKVSDHFWMRWPGGKEQQGYVPPDDLCGVRAGDDSDYMDLYLCLACGQVQGEWPKKSVKKWVERIIEEKKKPPKPIRNIRTTLTDDELCTKCGLKEAGETGLCPLCLENKETCENWGG